MSMQDRLNNDVEGWRPEAGESITGEVVAVDSRPSDYGDDYPTVEILTDEGASVLVHGFHSVLKRELANQKPQPGDKIGIRYAGLKPSKKPGGKDYEHYRVVVEHLSAPPEAPNWSQMGESAASELGPDASPSQPKPGTYNPLSERADEEPF